MNKIYKLIWSKSLNLWVVCSELGKKSKSKGGGVTVLISALGLLAAPTVFAAQCTSLSGWAGGNCEIYENTNYTTNIGWSGVVGASGGANKKIVKSNTDSTLGDFIINSNTSSIYPDYASSGFGVNNGTLTANKLSVTLRPETGKLVRVFGATAFNGGEITTKDLDVDLVFARETQSVIGPIESYAVQVGTAIKGEDRSIGKTSKITVNNANLKITNTAATQDTYFIPGLGAYNLSGIRLIRNEDNLGSNAIFESTGKVTINAFDSSTSNTGTYITGIYVSGDDNKAILNDSAITIGKSGQYSSALKIGKGRNTGTGGGTVESHGNMLLDTTAESTAPTVRLIGTGSKLIADYSTSSSEIKSANTAVLFGSYDYNTRYKSTDQEVLLKNAKINTTSTNASLILVNAGVTGAKMSVTGKDSLLTAASDGWLVEVEDPSKWSTNNAGLSFTLSENAKAQGLMNVSGASTLDVNLDNGAIWELKSKTGLTEQRSTLTSFNLTSNAVLDAATNLTSADAAEYFVTVPLFNNDSGIINLDNGKYQDKLTIEGNYNGSGNATVKMNTIWNAPGNEQGTNSESDVLRITGTATGMTTVIPVSSNGSLNLIDGSVQQIQTVINTIPVIYVEQAGADAFTGSARTTGISQVDLVKRANGNSDEYYWTAKAKDVDIYNPETPNYTQMPIANMELGYSTLGTLHERRGENQTLAWDECGTCVKDNKGQSWGRIVGSHLDLEGKNRFNMSGEQYLMQLGHDFIINENAEKQSRNHTGAYISYGRSDMDFEDKYRAVNGQVVDKKYTGNGKTDAFSLGLYNTHYDKNGSYLDLVGQVSHLRNTYNTSGLAEVKQNGFGAVLSAEVGRPYALTEHKDNESGWMIEPQAQLVYQYLGLDSFHDDVRTVDQNDQHGLRGRLGVRLAHNSEAKDLRTNTVYFTANVLHDFLEQSDINIGPDSINEKYNNTWGSIGVGMQLPVSQHGYFYADGRYEHSFTSEKRETYKGTLGLKFTWK